MIAQLLGGQVLPATAPAGRLRGPRAGGPVTSSPPSTPWSRTRPGPGDGGWPGCRRPTRWATSQRADLSEALARLTGNPVDLQVTVDPALLGGVVVQVGDLLVDCSTRHRLDELKEHLLASEAAYRIPAKRREATDG